MTISSGSKASTSARAWASRASTSASTAAPGSFRPRRGVWDKHLSMTVMHFPPALQMRTFPPKGQKWRMDCRPDRRPHQRPPDARVRLARHRGTSCRQVVLLWWGDSREGALQTKIYFSDVHYVHNTDLK